MIRVTVELLPFSSEARRENLGTINIVNDGTGDEYVGDYDVTLVQNDRVVQHVRVLGHRRDAGWGDLVRRAISTGIAEQ